MRLVGRDVEVVQPERIVHGVPVGQSRSQERQSQDHGSDCQERERDPHRHAPRRRAAYGRGPHTSGRGDGWMISYTSMSRYVGSFRSATRCVHVSMKVQNCCCTVSGKSSTSPRTLSLTMTLSACDQVTRSTNSGVRPCRGGRGPLEPQVPQRQVRMVVQRPPPPLRDPERARRAAGCSRSPRPRRGTGQPPPTG